MSTLRSLSGGCRLTVLAVSLSFSLTAQGPYFTGATPVAELNQTGTSSFSPSVSEDERYMVFASNRPGGLGGHDLYETSRANVDAPWSPPTPLPQLNSSADDYEPNLSYDGLSLHFISTRAGIGPSDIFVSQRSAIGQPWGPPQNLGMPINQPNFANDDPALSEDGLTLFFTSNGGGAAAGGADVYMATRSTPNGTFGAPQPFAPANSSAFDHSPMVEGNGDTVYFSSTRAGGPVGGSDFYMVVRDPQTMTYSAPEPLGDLCTTGWDANATRGITGRVYVSQFVGGNSQIVCYCAFIKIVRVLRCVESWLLVVYIPPRWYVIRVWRVQWTISSITIVIYDWRRYAAGGVRALLAGLAIQNPPLDPNLIFAGSQGQIFLSGTASTLAATPIAPGQSPGLQTTVLGIPPNPALIGLQLHMQDVGLDLATTTLSVSEAGTIAIQ